MTVAAAAARRSRALQVIFDDAADGAWNMAVDEALLTTAAAACHPVLRFYRWRKPTLSLGYFQSYGDVDLDRWPGVALVRRTTGGGAILHDGDLTYSLILPPNFPPATRPRQVYDVVHGVLCALLQDAGLAAQRCGSQRAQTARGAPFLCFERRAEDDLLLEKEKIAGSAQRRHHGSLLQHGSVALRSSPLTPHLPGLDRWHQPDLADLTQNWAGTIARRWQREVVVAALTQDQQRAAEDLAQCRYADNAWLKRR